MSDHDSKETPKEETENQNNDSSKSAPEGSGNNENPLG